MGQSFSRSALAKYIANSDKPKAELAKGVAAFLIDTGKTSDLDSLMRDVIEVRASKQGIVELTARSAFALSPPLKSEIESLVSKQYPEVQKVIIHEIVDKSVIGGVHLQFANASLDLTIRAKLNKLRESIT